MIHTPPANEPNDGRFVAAGIAAALALLALIGFDVHLRPARAQAGDPPGPAAPPPARASRSEFLREMHLSLRANDQRLIRLARQVLDVPNYGSRIRDLTVEMRIIEKSAEAAYLNARLAREVAELSVREYKEGIFIQDRASVEGDIMLAENDLNRARDRVQFAGMVNADDGEKLWTRLYERSQAVTLEAAEMKKRALLEYTAPRTIKELEVEVAKATADERWRKAEWDFLKRRLDRIEKAIADDWRRDHIVYRGLDMLRRAAAIEQQVRAKVDQLAGKPGPDDALQKEIRDLTNQLGAIIDEAEAVKAEDDFADVKARIREAARRFKVSAAK